MKATVERMRREKGRGGKEEKRGRKRGTTRAWNLLQPEEEQMGFKTSVGDTVMLEGVDVVGRC